MIPKGRFIFTVGVFVAMCLSAQAAHFRGGTISWRPEGGTKVHFYFKVGFTYGNGAGCTRALIGQFVNKLGKYSWDCQEGCGGTAFIMPKVGGLNYFCLGADPRADWEQGQNNFTYVFPNEGPFKVGFANMNWLYLSNGGGGGGWNLATTIDLRKRSDTGEINYSPVSLSKPMYYTQFNCEVVLHVPVTDPDGDTVRCRWAVGGECSSICHSLPGATLDEKTCTIHFNSAVGNGYKNNGVYAVALTIEDFPKAVMTMGNRTLTPSDAISSIPLQFLVTTVAASGPCNSKPRFVPPTPGENDVITAVEGDKLDIDLVADNGNSRRGRVTQITFSGPLLATSSRLISTVGQKATYQITFNWQTTHKDIGEHIVCGSVENSMRQSGDDRCFKINVVPKGCLSSPCQNSGKCRSNMGTFICSCRPGFSGKVCDTTNAIITTTTTPTTTHTTAITTTTTTPTTTTTTTTTTFTTTHTSPTKTTTTPKTTTTKRQTMANVYTMTTTTTASPTPCPLEYDCQCVFTPHRHRYYGIWTSLSRHLRDLIAFIFGLPIGLLLSLVTFWMYLCCVELCRGDEKRYPRQKPQRPFQKTRATKGIRPWRKSTKRPMHCYSKGN